MPSCRPSAYAYKQLRGTFVSAETLPGRGIMPVRTFKPRPLSNALGRSCENLQTLSFLDTKHVPQRLHAVYTAATHTFKRRIISEFCETLVIPHPDKNIEWRPKPTCGGIARGFKRHARRTR